MKASSQNHRTKFFVGLASYCRVTEAKYPRGQIAQSVEQWTENPRVGSSILPLATTLFTYILAGFNNVVALRVRPILEVCFLYSFSLTL